MSTTLAALSLARRGAAALVVALPVIAFLVRGGLADPGSVPAGRGVWETTVGSLLLGLSAAGGATLLAIPAAMVLGRRAGSGLLVGLCLVPLLVPSYVLAIGWYPVLGSRGLLGGLSSPAPLHTPVGAGLVQAFQLWPIPALLGAAALARADARLDEAARLLAGRGLALRLAMPGLGAGFAVALVLSAGDFGVSGCFTLPTVSEEVYARYSSLRDHRAAALAALPLILLLPPLLLVAVRTSGRMRASDQRPWKDAGPVSRAAFLLVLAVAVGVPVGYLVRTGGAIVPKVASLHAGEIGSTLLYAGFGTLLGGALAILGTGVRSRALVEAGFLLPFALPGVITGLGVLALDRAAHGGLRDALGGGTLLVLGIAVRVAWLPWKAIDLTLVTGPDPALEAAAVHGAGPLARWCRILAPRSAPAFAAGLAAAFLLAVGEIGVVVLLLPPGDSTLSVRIFDMIHYGYNANVAALCLVMAGVLVLAVPLVVSARDAWRRA